MDLKTLLLSVAILFPFVGKGSGPLKLVYSSPAKEWVEALPVGNSRMGAMVFGGIDRERLQLNDETFWAGGPYSNNNPEGLKHLPEIRNLVFEGREKEAESLIEKYYMTPHHGMSYLTLGSLNIDFIHAGAVESYKRQLDISESVCEVSYKCGDIGFSRQTIASLPDGVIVEHLTASGKKALNFTLGYDLPQGGVLKVLRNGLDITVAGPDQEGISGKLTAKCGIRVQTDGKISRLQDGIKVVDA